MLEPDKSTALEFIRRGVSLTAFKTNEHKKKVPWCKDWRNVERLPISTEEQIDKAIADGCHGFQIRAKDAGLAVLDIDIKSGKDGRNSIIQAIQLHGHKIPTDVFNTGYIIQTPNEGYHVYLKPDELAESLHCTGILEGVDYFSSNHGLIAIAGSLGLRKSDNQLVPYQPYGTIDNANPVPPGLSKIFKTVLDARERVRAEKQAEMLKKAEQRRLMRSAEFGASIFDEASSRVTSSLVESLFGCEGSYWLSRPKGPELYTLSPLRPDHNIGSFSIRQDGIYSDWRDDQATSGDFIDLLEKSRGITSLEAAEFIIRETGGNPADYRNKPVSFMKPAPKPATTPPRPAPVDNDVPFAPFQEDPPEPTPTTADTASKLFPLKRLSEMTLEEDEWLVDRYFQADSLALVYGAPGSCKSFWALDLSLSIATGHQFHGNTVQQGPVMYMAGEGHRGIIKRATAWSKHHGIDAKNAPWWLAGRPFDLMDQMSVSEVLEAVDHHTQGVNPKLVVIDTLARNFGPGDENKASDMGAVIRNADAIRCRYGCLVIIVHHSGYEATRARGSSSLKAAMDFEYQVTKDGETVDVANTRIKDGDTPPNMFFDLVDIPLGVQSRWGDEMKSAVLIDRPDDLLDKKRTRSGTTKDLLLEIIASDLDERATNLEKAGRKSSDARTSISFAREQFVKSGKERQNFKRTLNALVDEKTIVLDGNDIRYHDESPY